MRTCIRCGSTLARVRRSFLEKFVCHAVLGCLNCGRRELQWYLFVLGRRSHCPLCGNFRLKRLRRVDYIDRMYKNPLSYLQKYLGANLYWCERCRLQFYDLRKASARQTGRTQAAGAGGSNK